MLGRSWPDDPMVSLRFPLVKVMAGPENWLYTEARRLFTAPDVTPASEIDLKWEKPDVEGLVAYMCGEKGFAEDRIRNGCKKLDKARGGSTQGRLDSFFKVVIFQSL